MYRIHADAPGALTVLRLSLRVDGQVEAEGTVIVHFSAKLRFKERCVNRTADLLTLQIHRQIAHAVSRVRFDNDMIAQSVHKIISILFRERYPFP